MYSGNLRCGYTTGSCAAAAAKSAAILLLGGEMQGKVCILLPDGARLSVPADVQVHTAEYAVCSVKKDSGDDPDITNGITVCANVSRIPEGIEILGGEGIGRVTKPGLDQPVGEWAINSVPRKMIAEALAEASSEYGYTGGFRVEISVPGGEALAARTYNPRMGIVGGISIIGTSGIVKPMSTAALIDTIRAEVSMRRAEGRNILLLTPGNFGSEFIRLHLPVSPEQSVQCSNFIGEALDIGLEAGFSGILLVGHAGKLVKLGAGIMNTHSAQADGRMETLVTCGVLAGVDTAVLRQIPDCMTVDAALDILDDAGCLPQVMGVLTERIDCRLRARVQDKVRIGAVLFSAKRPEIWQTEDAAELIQKLAEE